MAAVDPSSGDIGGNPASSKAEFLLPAATLSNARGMQRLRFSTVERATNLRMRAWEARQLRSTLVPFSRFVISSQSWNSGGQSRVKMLW